MPKPTDQSDVSALDVARAIRGDAAHIVGVSFFGDASISISVVKDRVALSAGYRAADKTAISQIDKDIIPNVPKRGEVRCLV